MEEDLRENLTKKVETNKGKPDPTEVGPVQKDFRSMLTKSVKTKTNQVSNRPEQKDFRSQLKNKGNSHGISLRRIITLSGDQGPLICSRLISSQSMELIFT